MMPACTLGAWLASLDSAVTVSTASVSWRAGEVLAALRDHGAELLAEPGTGEPGCWTGERSRSRWEVRAGQEGAP